MAVDSRGCVQIRFLLEYAYGMYEGKEVKRFIEGESRSQVTLLPERLDDYIGEDNPVRGVDVFVDELDLIELGFEGVAASVTGRPGYHPAVLLKLYIYGYLNRLQSSRRLERECQRNVELMWMTLRLTPDFKTIADFHKDNGTGIRNVCRRFVVMCRQLKLISEVIVAIDGSKFKAVNNRDKNFTQHKLEQRMRLAQTPEIWRSLDEWLRHRLRAIQLKQCKRGSTMYEILRTLGAAPHAAKRVADNSRCWWRNSQGDLQRVLTIAYFDRLDVPRFS